MNNYLSQIAVRAGGAITPHSLTPVQQQPGVFGPRLTDTGNDTAGALPALPAPHLTQDHVEQLLPEQPLPVQKQVEREVPEQQEKVRHRILYLERFPERSTANVQTNKTYTVTTNASPAVHSPATNTLPVFITGKVNDIVRPVAKQQRQSGSDEPSQVFAPRQDTPEKEVKQRIQPPTQQTHTVVAPQPRTPVMPPQAITTLTPRADAGMPVPQVKKTAPPKLTIGRITVEVLPPPAVPVQTVPRNRQRSTGSPIPAPGSNEIHKLSFGFGQL
ncbi:hypothetical protein L3C95_33010 [Chitinophaga filiformis]|uniref:hypothetical protein n=1 Tax=Chitinophaga filiformis TaxID=104663 RepID=UPI001F280E11|nr:hypothetical protein [Chitinophaga filiformis]MCF6407754.1 hypothetical protein [Chitinophaga filiformis]